MTEAEWLTATDPMPLLAFIKGKANDRKLRLFAVACCQRILHTMSDERSRKAVQVAERWADNLASEDERQEAQAAAQEVWDKENDGSGPEDSAAWAADVLVRGKFVGDQWVFENERWAFMVAGGALEVTGIQEQPIQASIVRCVFGNPFRPIVTHPSWLTSTVGALAHGIYVEKAFDRMPILADALMDAGCAQEDILNHCRQPGEHVRGCWVVDLLTGRK